MSSTDRKAGAPDRDAVLRKYTGDGYVIFRDVIGPDMAA